MRGAPGSREDPGYELLTAARRLSPGAAPAGGRPRGAVSGGHLTGCDWCGVRAPAAARASINSTSVLGAPASRL